MSSELFHALRKLGETEKWHLKYAKYNREIHQSLLAHCLNVAALSTTLLDYLAEKHKIKSTEKLRVQAMLTGFLHDVGKNSPSYQAAVQAYLEHKRGNPIEYSHQDYNKVKPLVDDFLEQLNTQFQIDHRGLGDEITWSIKELGRREHAGSVSYGFDASPSPDAVLCKELAHMADIITSSRSVEECVANASRAVSETSKMSTLRFVYTNVSTIRGLLTQVLHKAVEQLYEERGYKAIQWFPDGTIFLSIKDEPNGIPSASEITKKVKEELQKFLKQLQDEELAKAAFGNLTQTVISTPEFLFANEKVIKEFWNYIFKQNFADYQSQQKKALSASDQRLFGLLKQKYGDEMNEQELKAIFGRVRGDFNLLIVLYGIRKRLVESVNKDLFKQVGKESLAKIGDTLTKIGISQQSFKQWPEIVLQNSADEKLPVAVSLIESYSNFTPDSWRRIFKSALIEATNALQKMWGVHAHDKLDDVAQLLVGDLSHPLDAEVVMKAVEKHNQHVMRGKLKGTTICPKCGGAAELEALAKLFEASETYHDFMTAGSKIASPNKIRVCTLCDYEAKLRNLLKPEGKVLLILPQISLSRGVHEDWQQVAYNLTYSRGDVPNIQQLHRQAEHIFSNFIKERDPFLEGFDLTIRLSDSSRKRAMNELAQRYSVEGDLSVLVDPPVDVSDVSDLMKKIEKGECKLKPQYEQEYQQLLSGVRSSYYSPNYIFLMVGDPSSPRRDEAESVKEIRMLYLRCVLARLFHATVVPEDAYTALESRLGYTVVSTNLATKAIGRKLNAEGEWIPIEGLEIALLKLSALIAIDNYMHGLEADYGRDSLIRLLAEEPGKVIVRVVQKNGRADISPLIRYLDAWKMGQTVLKEV